MMQFTGEQRDETGLVYLRARYLDTSLAVFISRDPWPGGGIRSSHAYLYAEGNPITRTDPSGYCSEAGWNQGQGLFTEANCDRLEEGDLEFTEEWYYSYADYVEGSLPQTSANMRHYLDGSGSPLQLSEGFMQNDIYAWPAVEKAVTNLATWYVRTRIDDLEVCQPTSFGPHIYARGFTPPYWQAQVLWPFSTPQLDIAGSLGSFRLDVEIGGTLHRQSERRSAEADLDLHLVLLDFYNWDEGKSVAYEGNVILDDWALSLQDGGLAHSYLVRGDLTVAFNRTVSGLWLGLDVGRSPPGQWVESSCIGSQFDIDQEGPGQIDYCGNPMR